MGVGVVVVTCTLRWLVGVEVVAAGGGGGGCDDCGDGAADRLAR